MVAKPSILIVDVDSLTRWSLIQAGQGRYQVTAVSNEYSALTELRDHHYDLLVIGCSSGQLRCDEITQEARVLHPALPILVMCGMPLDQTMCDCSRRAAHLHSATSIHEKPFKLTRLMEDVDRLLNDTHPATPHQN
ncbi:MAG: hypothetical protein HJJLKODD_02430 [Phycisphaerae bacterium]|nr:hypothetical protein [Phycisphaerae bacterium]